MPTDIVIVGAGMAGLCAALSLAKHGFFVTVLEAFDQPSEIGAGIQIPPNACHVLNELDVLDALKAKAIAPDTISLGDAITGKQLVSLPVNRPGDTLPFLTAHRAALHGVLYDAALKIDAINLLTGHRLQTVTTDEDSVVLETETSNGSNQIDARLVIGADGIWSKTRQGVPDAAQALKTGRIALRAIAPLPSNAGDTQSVTAWLSPKAHLVSYPIRNADTCNLVAIVDGDTDTQDWAGSVQQKTLDILRKHFAESPMASVFETPDWTVWPLAAVQPGGPWDNGRNLALIGDAAHAMEPFAAQGAAMAIEDGYSLAQALSTNRNDYAHAIANYRKARLERIKAVSKRTAFNRKVYHMGGPARLARNFALSLRPADSLLKDLDWIYAYRV